MKKIIKNLILRSTLWIFLPTFLGCQGGGGGGSTLGSLFSTTTPIDGGEGLLSPLTMSIIDNGAGATGVISNPEPTTLLLLGSGFLLMSCFKNCKFDK